MKRKLEIRTLAKRTSVEENDTEKIVVGVIPYNVKSQRMELEYSDCEYEMLASTVFKKTLADKAEVYCNYAHDDLAILGNTKSETLILENKIDGLHFTLKLDPGNEIAMRAYSTIKRGDCNTLSFEFFPFDWEEKDNVCILRSAKLTAISICVINPAYTQTEIETIRERRISEVKKITRAIENKEMDLTNPETLKEVKELLETISKALPKVEETKEEPKENRKDEVEEKPKSETETNSQVQEKTPEQSIDTQTATSQEQEKVDEEDEAKKKQLEELQKELEKELSE